MGFKTVDVFCVRNLTALYAHRYMRWHKQNEERKKNPTNMRKIQMKYTEPLECDNNGMETWIGHMKTNEIKR